MTDCCELACYEDPGCLCDPCKIIKLERIREAVQALDKSGYLDIVSNLGWEGENLVDKLRYTLGEYYNEPI